MVGATKNLESNVVMGNEVKQIDTSNVRGSAKRNQLARYSENRLEILKNCTKVADSTVTMKVNRVYLNPEWRETTLGKEISIMQSCNDMKEMSLRVNPRTPSIEKTVLAMIKQLNEDGSMFYSMNSGISVYVSDLKIFEKDGEAFATFYFDGDTGVFNGGHSLLAIMLAKMENLNMGNAFVDLKVTILNSNVTKKEICSCAASKNNFKAVQNSDLAELQGYHNELKKYCGPYSEMIRFKSGELVGKTHIIPVVDLVRYMTACSRTVRNGKIQDGNNLQKNPKYGPFYKSMENGEVPYCQKVFPYAQEILETIDYIQRDLPNVKTKYYKPKEKEGLSCITETPISYDLSSLLLIPILYALSWNIWYDDKNSTTGLYLPFIDLYERNKDKLWNVVDEFAKYQMSAGNAETKKTEMSREFFLASVPRKDGRIVYTRMSRIVEHSLRLEMR